MSTTTIGSMTLGTAANLTGAAKLEFEDSAGASVYFTAATLRTKMFAGGTGYTASDPLSCGDITLPSGTVVTAGGSNAIKVDSDNTANNTRVFVGVGGGIGLVRVTLGSADSGGAGFRLLRVTN